MGSSFSVEKTHTKNYRTTRRRRYGEPRHTTRRRVDSRPRANTHYSVTNSPNNGSSVRGNLRNNGDLRFRPTPRLLERQLRRPQPPQQPIVWASSTPVRKVSFKDYRERQERRNRSGSGPHTPLRSRRNSEHTYNYSVEGSVHSGL